MSQDVDPVPGTGNFNSKKAASAQAKGALVSHDDAPYAHPTTAMTVADINARNRELWGNIGPAESQKAAPMLAGTKVGGPVPVYGGKDAEDSTAEERTERKNASPTKTPQGAANRKKIAENLKSDRNHTGYRGYSGGTSKEYHVAGGGEDEVSPTQSDPADRRSDNLLDRADGGIPGTEDEEPKKPKWSSEEVIRQRQVAIKKNPNEAKRIKEGKWRGEFAEDDLAEGTEAMAPEGQADAEHTPKNPKKGQPEQKEFEEENAPEQFSGNPSPFGNQTTTTSKGGIGMAAHRIK